ncbi:MAG: hypothetical protein AAF805_02885 [Planctomycetota bacterium]
MKTILVEAAWRLVLVAGLTATIAATTAVAAPPRGGDRGRDRGPDRRGHRPPPMGPAMLLRIDGVREELGVTEEQHEQLQDAAREMRGRMRELMPRRGERDRDAMREAAETLRGEARERRSEILEASQIERLDQIDRQVKLERHPVRALTDDTLGEQLGLDEEQSEQLQDRSRDLREEVREKVRERMREIVAEARAEAKEELLEVLTSQQRSQLDDLLGEPIDVDEMIGPPPHRHGPARGEGRHEGRRRGGRDDFRGRSGRGGFGPPAPGFGPPPPPRGGDWLDEK